MRVRGSHTPHGTGARLGASCKPASPSSGAVPSPSQHAETQFMMNQTDGWMHGWSGGGMWAWTVVGLLVVGMLIVAIGQLLKKK